MKKTANFAILQTIDFTEVFFHEKSHVPELLGDAQIHQSVVDGNDLTAVEAHMADAVSEGSGGTHTLTVYHFPEWRGLGGFSIVPEVVSPGAFQQHHCSKLS